MGGAIIMFMSILTGALLAQAQIINTNQTADPTITNAWYEYTGGNYYVYWTVRNNDALTATLKAEVNDSTPDLLTRNVASNATWTFNQIMGPFFAGAFVYVTAQASGKDISNVVSAFVDI